MGKLVLYGAYGSPAVRGVLLALKELDLEYEFKEINVHSGETRTEEFLKKNPQHTVPVLEDDGEAIWDSHAIMAYLARKYGKNDALYPKDCYQRAVVDQRLHFESGVISGTALKGYMSPHKSQEEKVADVEEMYDFLEQFLVDTYIAGDHLTIADLSILASVSTINMIHPVNASGTRPKLGAWLELLQQLPYYQEANSKGLEIIAALFKPKTTSNGEGEAAESKE